MMRFTMTQQRIAQYNWQGWFWALLPVLLVLVLPHVAWAQVNTPDGTCTNHPQFDIPQSSSGYGLISSIVVTMQSILTNIAASMFGGIAGDPGFQAVVKIGVTLYIAIYGILFTFGMAQITMHDFAIRMTKIVIIGILLSPNAWGFFYNTVVLFFNGGTDELINLVVSIAVGGVPGGAPFSQLDYAVSLATSAKMTVTLMAIFGTGPYGFIIGLLLVMALGSFLKSLIQAMWVYLMALVMRTLLFGLAPIFIACLLFTRTKHLFDGWINQLVNAALQPVLLFAFFSFFAVLIGGSLSILLQRPVCWTEWAESLRGSPFSEHFWRFTVPGDTGWEPFPGTWDFAGKQGGGEIFPIDIITVLVLLILVELSGRFNHVVQEIARDLAGAASNFSGMHGSFFSAGGSGGGSSGGLFGGGGAGAGGGGGGAGGGGLLGGLFGGGGSGSGGPPGVGKPPPGTGAPVKDMKDKAGGMVSGR